MPVALNETFNLPAGDAGKPVPAGAELPGRMQAAMRSLVFSDCGRDTNKREERGFRAEIDHNG